MMSIISYKTIKLNLKQTRNNESTTPWIIATDIVNAIHEAG